MMKQRVPQGTTAAVIDDRILTTKEVLARIPLDRSTIWKLCREGKFPQPIQLTPSRIGWQLSALSAWIEERKQNPLLAHVNFARRRR